MELCWHGPEQEPASPRALQGEPASWAGSITYMLPRCSRPGCPALVGRLTRHFTEAHVAGGAWPTASQANKHTICKSVMSHPTPFCPCFNTKSLYKLLTIHHMSSPTTGTQQLPGNYTTRPVTIAQVEGLCSSASLVSGPAFPVGEANINSAQAAMLSGAVNCTGLVAAYILVRAMLFWGYCNAHCLVCK